MKQVEELVGQEKLDRCYRGRYYGIWSEWGNVNGGQRYSYGIKVKTKKNIHNLKMQQVSQHIYYVLNNSNID